MAKQTETLKGILVLNKPSGMTSHDCIYRVRKLAGMKKVGHTGTLDPDVTGVLPICLGQATRVAEYLLDYDKEYIAEVTLGQSTETEDQAGDVIEDRPLDVAPTEQQVRQALQSFLGDIDQVPPMYSAVKVNGVPLYRYAREGKHVERQSRRVRIYDIDLLAYDPTCPYPKFKIRVRCSKGTYIRTLGVDLAHSLGYPGHLNHLIRTKSGPFTLDDAVTFEDIEAWSKEQWQVSLHAIDNGLQHLKPITVDQTMGQRLINGQTLVLEEQVTPRELYRVYVENQGFIAVCQAVGPRHIKPKKVFK
ncbi:tRNA pseudouridine(55) synthase TruB [Caldalkalibacillus salinus]|uniref:tRNA pseudouridine(55) synthase TruB n=1 Tax=Caldalkalibacillus salinus TaxID=2803787 RepID=UPI0019222C0A|nr:tRNA pseudouridine(55) synthase TruB [Caldalkalibacillus salinus]